ncbi:protocadherin gamma-A4-like [Protopterus annectens]|uniref:protocadherin gamma-A4-like n=1 Tax=Protopterus annectens TaxID=7888 RepID=UPI001CF9B19F|nr:protocadherin gamma-A4-like [Protopterus annectens]
MDSAIRYGWWRVGQYLFVFSFYSLQCLSSGIIHYSIPEEVERGSFVGHIATDVGIPLEDVIPRRFRVTATAKNRFFSVNLDTGDLYVTERIDREHICGKMPVCLLAFEAVAENPLQVFAGEVEIQDINDNPPVFLPDEIKLSISELTYPGARFPLGQAEDTDTGTNAALHYELKPTEYFNLLVMGSGSSQYIELVLNKTLDHEKINEHSLVLTIKDQGVPKRSGTAQIQINVVDVNDNIPVFSQKVYRSNLKENMPKGTLVVKVSATDGDGGSHGEVRYTFKKITDTARSLFKLHPVTGDIILDGVPDFEEAERFEITVEAKDGGGLTALCEVFVEIVDQNDNAPQITISPVVSELSEDSLPGIIIAFVNVVDLDSSENGEVVCNVQEYVPFKLLPSFKNYYTLELNGSLDREEVPEYNITIIAVDKGSPPLSTLKILYLRISDINDNPPLFSKGEYHAYVTENNPVGYVIHTVEAKDADWSQNAHITYSIAPSHAGYSLISSCVSINPDNGNIYALRSFDYEAFRDFQVMVKAVDGGSPSLSTNVTVNIFIQDENDNIPKILYPLPSDETSTGIEVVPPLAETNYLVTKVVAVDADSGQNAWLSYQLLRATDANLFKVGYHTGEIRTSGSVLAKEPSKQTLFILVKDNGQPPHSSTATVTVFIADSIPQSLLDTSSSSENRDQDSNITLYLVISVISVSALFLCFIVIIVIIKVQRWRQSSLLQTSFVDYNFQPSNYEEVQSKGLGHTPYIHEVCLTSNPGRTEFQFMRPLLTDTMAGKIATGTNRLELYPNDALYADSNAVSQEPCSC